MIVGTLGKALGSYGAYVCGSRQLVELLVNTARPFIYSTAPPPPSVGAALAALGLLAERPGLVEQLRRNAATLRQALSAQGLVTGSSRTQIVPVMVGDARRAMALCERTLEAGVFAQAIRPADRPGGQLAPAADGDGEPPRRRARLRGARRSRAPPAGSGCQPTSPSWRCARQPEPLAGVGDGRGLAREPLAVGDRRGLGPAADVELGEDARDVDAGGLLRHVELLGDLAVRGPRGEQLEHLALARGEAEGLVAGGLGPVAVGSGGRRDG